jgi:thiol-disulfide isomerase/thioredoxin
MLNHKTIFIALALFIATSDLQAQIKFGFDAPDISLPTPAGDTLHLASLKGKVVLLDFWASWCGPCRASNKQLVKTYAKFKDKGFEIYSVSFDEEKPQWEKAIRKDKISWLQVNDNRGFDAQTAADWRINQIPTSFLIDKDGKLVAMDPEGKDLENMLKDLLGK